MRNSRVWFSVTALLFLTACATHWDSVDKTKTAQDFTIAKAACQYDVGKLQYQSNYATPSQPASNGLSALGDSMSQVGAGRDLFVQCMMSKGFYPK
jgi:hypothetical protein